MLSVSWYCWGWNECKIAWKVIMLLKNLCWLFDKDLFSNFTTCTFACRQATTSKSHLRDSIYAILLHVFFCVILPIQCTVVSYVILYVILYVWGLLFQSLKLCCVLYTKHNVNLVIVWASHVIDQCQTKKVWYFQRNGSRWTEFKLVLEPGAIFRQFYESVQLGTRVPLK